MWREESLTTVVKIPCFFKISAHGIGVAKGYNVTDTSPFHPTEWTMNAKKRRKVFGVRRETRRPRGWTRWFHEGLFEAEASGSIRLRTVLWGPK